MTRPEKILICYNEPISVYDNYSGKEGLICEDTSETSLIPEIENIASILKEEFSSVNILPVNSDIRKFILKVKDLNPDVIFNFVEAIEGISSFEYCFAGLYELLEIAYTGNHPVALANCLNKTRAKKILLANGINTPKSLSIKHSEIKIYNSSFTSLKFPVIIKLLLEDASIGISENSVVNSIDGLNAQLAYLKENFKSDVIIEEFIDGREINAAILNGTPLPLSEIKFDTLPDGLPKIVTYEGKWVTDSVYYKNTIPQCPAIVNAEMESKIKDIAVKAFNALDCRDYARVDIRLNIDDEPYVIEVNPNPDISTDTGFDRAAKAFGLSYKELLLSILESALNRVKYDKTPAEIG